MHFILLYVACCVVLGSVLSFVALIVGGILYFGFGYFGFGADFIADSSSSLGGVGIGLSVAFLGSFVVAIVGTIMMVPTEKNRRAWTTPSIVETCSAASVGRRTGRTAISPTIGVT
jgi:hypothetical protein